MNLVICKMVRVVMGGLLIIAGSAGSIYAQQQFGFDSTQTTRFKERQAKLKRPRVPFQPTSGEFQARPLKGRIVWGLTFQVSRINRRAATFINPWIGYRVNQSLTLGAGWNESAGGRRFHFFRHGRASGPRIFADYKLRQKFSIRTEIEMLNAYNPNAQVPFSPNTRERIWVWGLFAGVKREFILFKSFAANIQVLYNMYSLIDKHPVNIYGDPLMLRVGFEFPLRRKKSHLPDN